MKYADYQKAVIARCSKEFHGNIVPVNDFTNALAQFIKWGNVLDRAKKSLFYGRPFFEFHGGFLPGEEPELFNEEEVPAQGLIHAILGHATESVEMVEALLKFVESGTWDDTNLQEEFGDAEWYRALGLAFLGQTHEDNLTQNDAKLEKRYGPAFSKDKANNRNLDAERKTLEQGK